VSDALQCGGDATTVIIRPHLGDVQDIPAFYQSILSFDFSDEHRSR
jgi:hypothetical protein